MANPHQQPYMNAMAQQSNPYAGMMNQLGNIPSPQQQQQYLQQMQQQFMSNNPQVTEQFLQQRVGQLNSQFLGATQQLLSFAQELEKYGMLCKRNIDGTLAIMSPEEATSERQRRAQLETERQAAQMNLALQNSPQFNEMAKMLSMQGQALSQIIQRMDGQPNYSQQAGYPQQQQQGQGHTPQGQQQQPMPQNYQGTNVAT